MLKVNQIFNDTYYTAKILVDATRLRNTLETNRDLEIDDVEDTNEKQEILNNYKRKLQSIYRIRNNAFSFLLKNGFQCTYKIDEDDNNKIFYMNIEGTVYDCKESAVKNILGKDYEEVVKYCLSDDEFQEILKEEAELEKQIEEETNIKKSETEKSENHKTSKSSETSVSMEATDEALDTFMELNSLLVEAENDTVEQPEKIEQPKKQPKRCPRCFAIIEDGKTVCDFCGYDTEAKEMLSREELTEMDDSEEFSEEDIDRMFEELEKRLNEEAAKKEEAERLEQEEKSKPTPISYINEDEFKTVRLYNPEKSEPFKHKNDLILDIYTLELKDPKPEEDPNNATQHKEDHRRKRKDEYEEELLAEQEAEEEEEQTREVKIFVYPLSVPETGNELSSEILVYIMQDGNYGAFCSGVDGINSVKVNTNIHNFIVRGTWENGNFETKIFANGKTLADNCEVSRKKEEIRPDNIIAAKLGHPITFLTVEYTDGTETMKIHAVPLTDKNDEDGYAKTLYLMENVNKKERKLFVTKSVNYITFEFENEIYKATSQWTDDNIFKMNVENY